MQDAITIILLLSIGILLWLYYKSSKRAGDLALELFQREFREKIKELRKLDAESDKAIEKAVSDYNASITPSDTDTKH